MLAGLLRVTGGDPVEQKMGFKEGTTWMEVNVSGMNETTAAFWPRSCSFCYPWICLTVTLRLTNQIILLHKWAKPLKPALPPCCFPSSQLQGPPNYFIIRSKKISGAKLESKWEKVHRSCVWGKTWSLAASRSAACPDTREKKGSDQAADEGAILKFLHQL